MLGIANLSNMRLLLSVPQRNATPPYMLMLCAYQSGMLVMYVPVLKPVL